MNGDAGLVGCLVGRLATRLPHRTGNHGASLAHDEIVAITRTTLVKVSHSSMLLVLDALLSLIEELARPYSRNAASHPPHVLLSELFVLGLLAQCCSSHWDGEAGEEKKAEKNEEQQRRQPKPQITQHTPRQHRQLPPPVAVDAALARRVFDVVKMFLAPPPDGHVLSAKTLLDDCTTHTHAGGTGAASATTSGGDVPRTPVSARSDDATGVDAAQTLEVQAVEIEAHVRAIVEYVSAASWRPSLDYLKTVIYRVRTALSLAPQPPQMSQAMIEEERMALVVLRLVSFFWVDRQRLGQVLQEVCTSFLHFRKHFQNVVAVSAPLVIFRWIERFPGEFVELHELHLRVDGTPESLFDMAQAAGDSTRRRALLFPLQTALVLLLPDVFEVASNMREAKGGSVAKKVAFLENLRKLLRNRNEKSEQATYCLVAVLRAARHFVDDDGAADAGDAALLSYAMDFQDEVRETLFRKVVAPADAASLDQDLLTAAFVSLSHLRLDTSAHTLAARCLAPTMPLPFRLAVIQACSHFARLPDADVFEPLFQAASAFVQYQMRAMASQLTSAYVNAATAVQKTADHSVSITTICAILEFLSAAPRTLFLGEPSDAADSSDAFFRDNCESFMACLVVGDESVRRLAVHVAPRVFTDAVVARYQASTARLPTNAFRRSFWKLTSLVLSSLCDRISPYRLEAGLKNIHNYLESRLLLLRFVHGLSELAEEVPERTACSVKLETLFLVSLCSADIETCQLVTSCIDFFLEECQIIDTASKGAKSSSTLLRNGDVFREIASKEFRFTGAVAFQRRVDGLLKKMQLPSPGIVTAWELAFGKWLHLSKDVSTIAPEVLPERTLVEWRNCSGFLASVGGICTAAHQASVLEESSSTAMSMGLGGGGLRWIDRVPPDGADLEPLLSRFLRLSIQLLASANVRVRETMRELLSFEIAPTLYQALFQTLDAELDMLFTGVLDETPGSTLAAAAAAAASSSGRSIDSEVVFVEQAVSLLRALIERLDSPSDLGAASSVHLGALALNFVKFLNTAPDVPNTLRVKIKACQLCEAVTKRKEHLNLRDDVRVRNQLLDLIFGWIARPHSPPPPSSTKSGGRQQDEALRVQKDLDRACLRCLAELTYRLPLQPAEGQSDAGTSELKSHMFHTYFNRFLSLLNMEQAEMADVGLGVGMGVGAVSSSASSSELSIVILSNLLSSNLDVGLKRSLSIGYHDNVEIRTAFVRVLCNILMQGTEFSNLSDLEANDKYDDLIEILTNGTALATAMTAACPSAEVDELTISLLCVFESRGRVFDVLAAVIQQEIDETDNETELFRRASVATKMLTVYAKWKGAAYLKATLQKVVERLMMTLSANDLDFELDPDRVKPTADLANNALQLQVVAKVFIDDIRASAPRMPPSFRRICHIINTAVAARFPDAKYTAVGAFVFLRFFCPAIVAPEMEGLVQTVPSKEMRRSLLLITKVIQNLANNVLFGAKESYMFPLNHFLSENIYDVTAFLRKISEAPPPRADDDNARDRSGGSETDFGAAVSLHRFLYDHWDSVRQRLVAQERRDLVRAPGDGGKGTGTGSQRALMLEQLRNLITHLGPPPLAITWNRPQITLNSPPAYSAFQNFMLRNAMRSTDSLVTARAVYDGGERIDGMSMICIILRYIDVDAIDFDTLLYCYLKIASRLWHKPFGLFIDATCYTGQKEPQDQLFQKLEALSPTELSRQLSHVYIYNMNSTFRKCFRRILRTAARNGGGVFHPDNVTYHLYSNLQDLQTEFHLSKLHLPKETLSVVSDTRYVFQPTTRLSRSRGRIEVGIHVGSQFVQVTTTQKQEIHQGFALSAIFNDIFRLSDIEQAPLTLQADEDDTMFGLRADSGRVVMCFASPKKQEILAAIRSAKTKYREARGLKLLERIVRPQDVPGTLLNLALTNLGSADARLRLSAYNLLGALCRAFQFAAAPSLLCTKDVAVPLDPARFIVDVSTRLAQSEPQLTMDFLNEFFVGWDSVPEEQKPLSLAYMAPWLPGLRTHVLPAEADGGDKARDKIAGLFRKLIEVALSDPGLSLVLETAVWPAICGDETLLDIFLEEVVKHGLALGGGHGHGHGPDDEQQQQAEALTAIVTAMGTVTLRGKIMARLRKALNRTSLRPTKHLPDNVVWAEICVLLQFCVALSFGSGVQAQLYLAEVFHVVTLLANTGGADVRFLVHRLLTNSLHAVCTSFALDEARLGKLRGALESLATSELAAGAASSSGGGGGSGSAAGSTYWRDGASMVSSGDGASSTPSLAATEALAGLLFELCSVAAPTVDMANGWRARWMSLVASTAFQNNPAIQARAFTVMGCLAREVDDDLLYQVLVALRTSIGRFGDDSSSSANSDMVVAIVTALSKMLGRLPAASRYGYQLFWLAVSLLRLVPAGLFNCTAQFLEAVLANIGASGELRGSRMVPFLLQGRAPLEEAALALDEACGIHFTREHFHFAACACLVRGLTDAATKTTALRVVATLLALASDEGDSKNKNKTLAQLAGSPYLALILARAGTTEELRDSLWHVGISAASVPSLEAVHDGQDVAAMDEKDLLLNTAMELVDFRYLDDGLQHRTLRWLDRLAREKAKVVLHLGAPIASMLDDVLLHGQNAATLAAAHALLQTLSANAQFAQVLDARSVAGLEAMQFGGLWTSCTFSSTQEPDAHCFGLAERLIELTIL